MTKHTDKPERIEGKSSSPQKDPINLKTNTALQMENAKIEFKVI